MLDVQVPSLKAAVWPRIEENEEEEENVLILEKVAANAGGRLEHLPVEVSIRL